MHAFNKWKYVSEFQRVSLKLLSQFQKVQIWKMICYHSILQQPLQLLILVLTVFFANDVPGDYFLTLSSHKRGRCSNISSGSVSAAMTINSAMPRLRHLVAIRNL